MVTIPRVSLDTFFRLFAPEYVLGTTYTISLAFFESSVFPRIDRSKLRKCLVLCDRLGLRRATVEATALRAASREYMVEVAPTEARFHPKLWVMLGEAQLAILVGSGNLTHSGFIDNTELFDVLEARSQGPGRPPAQSVLRFVSGLRGLWRDTPRRSLPVVDTLAEIEERVSSITGTMEDEPLGEARLLTSFDGPFLDRFAEIGRGGALYIASPYFGGSVAGVTALQTALKPRSTRVFPAVHRDNLDVPLADWEGTAKTTVHALALAAKNAGFAHLKLYGFEGSNGQCWLFSGSVNCTTAGLGGANVEAGVLRCVPKSVLASCFAPDRRAALPSELRQQKQDDALDWLAFHATDVGDAIEMSIPAQGDIGRQQLNSAHHRVRAGSFPPISPIPTRISRLRDPRGTSGDKGYEIRNDFRPLESGCSQ
jgi:hypothetical protein